MLVGGISLFLKVVLSLFIKGGIDISVLAKISCEVVVIFDTDCISGPTIDLGA